MNLSNQRPTECLNQIFRERNLPEWSNETFLAKFMNQFEVAFDMLAKANTQQQLAVFLTECENNWIHKYEILK